MRGALALVVLVLQAVLLLQRGGGAEARISRRRRGFEQSPEEAGGGGLEAGGGGEGEDDTGHSVSGGWLARLGGGRRRRQRLAQRRSTRGEVSEERAGARSFEIVIAVPTSPGNLDADIRKGIRSALQRCKECGGGRLGVQFVMGDLPRAQRLALEDAGEGDITFVDGLAGFYRQVTAAGSPLKFKLLVKAMDECRPKPAEFLLKVNELGLLSKKFLVAGALSNTRTPDHRIPDFQYMNERMGPKGYYPLHPYGEVYAISWAVARHVGSMYELGMKGGLPAFDGHDAGGMLGVMLAGFSAEWVALDGLADQVCMWRRRDLVKRYADREVIANRVVVRPNSFAGAQYNTHNK